MTKYVAMLFFAILMIIAISGCDSGMNNEIGLANLTTDQQDIVDLLTINNQEVLIFDYQSDSIFEFVDFWVEVHANGELVENLGGLSFMHCCCSTGNSLNGRLSVTINNEADRSYRWLFGASKGGGVHASSRVEFAFHTEDIGNMPRSWGPTQEPIPIQDGRDIILYKTKFHSGDYVSIDGSVSFQDYIDRPELLEKYPYAIFIKARFSNAVR